MFCFNSLVLAQEVNQAGKTQLSPIVLEKESGTKQIPKEETVTIKPEAKAQETAKPSPIIPQSVDFNDCNKLFKVNEKILFYLTLAGINANRFEINEIQSKCGYILFTAAKKQFLASIIKIDSKKSMLKITPCSNIYYFPPGIIQNMFKYVDLNINTPIEKLKVL